MQNNPQPKWESLVLIRNIVLAQIFGFCQLARVMKTLKSFFFFRNVLSKLLFIVWNIYIFWFLWADFGKVIFSLVTINKKSLWPLLMEVPVLLQEESLHFTTIELNMYKNLCFQEIVSLVSISWVVYVMLFFNSVEDGYN